MIDDDKSSVDQLLDDLNDLDGFECEYCDFNDTEKKLSRFRPGIVVLDLLLDTIEAPGEDVFAKIWDSCFSPLVIYSADPDRIPTEHPLVAKVHKGSGSELGVVEKIREFLIPAQALISAEDLANTKLRYSLKKVAPKVLQSDVDVIHRVTMRHFAATLDVQLDNTTPQFAWEQFIYPPVHDHLTTGDILRTADGNPQDPADFRVVLTPTCDLVRGQSRVPKVESVLVSKCCEFPSNFPKKRVSLGKVLTSVFHDDTSSLIVPGFADVIPPMLANLKSLEMIDLKAISLDENANECRFVRVTSIDSPFREMATWAYLRVAGTPGLPDRNLEEWACAIEGARGS